MTGLKVEVEELLENGKEEVEYCTNEVMVVDLSSQERTKVDATGSGRGGLFGLHMVPADSSTVVVTDTELDALAVYQQTGIAAVSLPSAAFQLPLKVVSALDRFERIYVWMEDTFLGREAAEGLCQKLGVDRTLIVRHKSSSSKGCTRPIDSLRCGDLQAFDDAMHRARPLRHDKIMDFSVLSDSVLFELMNPGVMAGVKSTMFPAYNDILKGLRPGELTVFSGPTGVGKTTVLSQLSLDFCKSRVPTLWGSFEIPNTRLASRMLAQFAGEDLSTKPEAQLRKHMSRFMGLPMYFLKFHGSTDPDTVIETMRHAVYAYDVKHIIIDNLQFMMSVHGHTKFSGDKYDLQDAAVASFRRFATEQRVHITLVVHIRKEQSSSSLDLNSIFGSAKTTQEADNVLMLQKLSRSSSKRYLEVLKNRYDGTLGKIYLSYDKDSSSIKQIAEPPPRQRNVKLIRPATGLDELTQLRISESTELL